MKEHIEDQVIEMLNGCICCTVREDLSKVLKKFIADGLLANLDGVIVETTGMADPAPVAATFMAIEEIAKAYRLDCIITVVDAVHIEYHLDKRTEKDIAEDGIENESIEQLVFANLVLLNKTDVITDEEKLQTIEKRIRSINSMCKI